QLRIPRTIHLAHAAFAQQCGNVVRAKLLPNCDRHEGRRDYSQTFRGAKQFRVGFERCHSPSTSPLIPATKLMNGRVSSRSTKWCTKSLLCLISGTNRLRHTSKCRQLRVRRICCATTKTLDEGRFRVALTAMNY